MTTTDVNPLEAHTSPTDTIDWEACWSLASRLGAHTRTLIVDRDYEGAREWALRMAHNWGETTPANGPRAISYFELAVLLGYRANETQEDARLDWDALLAKVSTLQRSVQKKVDAEKAAAEKVKAEAKAVAESEEQEEVSGDERDDN
jgi:hypothetical protein